MKLCMGPYDLLHLSQERTSLIRSLQFRDKYKSQGHSVPFQETIIITCFLRRCHLVFCPVRVMEVIQKKGFSFRFFIINCVYQY